ncbi:MAG: ribose-phosphate pyrophosphokinase, partial [Proteobacteria bacterium]|nr:ribose-phosphate pyrophosphokinase [Pseudomonadota bacterium]
DELLVTNTIPLSREALACGKIRQLSIAEILAEAIRRVALGDSISNLFVE